MGIARPSASPWSSLLHLVPKNSGESRPCLKTTALLSTSLNQLLATAKRNFSSITLQTEELNRYQKKLVLFEIYLHQQPMMNFYRKFIKNAVELLAPFSDILTGPNINAELEIFSDASSTAVDAVLQQNLSHIWQPLAFYIQTLPGSICKLSTSL
ncbi:unnamed protein product [Ceratitis capitata]|uniref:(Mediterranean fruit fly) hypothetical protein n=1 Tax=Ceratitis capitata TaxID=7213 RepID=A0A811UQ64_CERCA|nr:unnamed protein product [Ceratitis capitata]